MYNITTKIKKAKIKFFRRTSGLQFFGILSYKFIWEVQTLPKNEIGHVLFNTDTKKLEDGRIYLNEYYLNKEDYTYDNLIFLICHELLHILKRHGARKHNRDRLIYNFAADHVNDRELKELKLIAYNNQFNIIKELHNQYPKCTTEEAYDWIYQNSKQFEFDYTNSIVTDTNTGKQYIISKPPDDQHGKSKKETELTIQKVNQMIAEARSISNSLQKKGNISGSFSEFLNKLLKIELPWGDIVEKAIKTNYIRKISEPSWRSLNKYYLPHNLTMPGYSYDDDSENVGTLIILADTSGSILKKQLQQFSYIINKFIHYFDSVLLLTHDTIIHQIKKFNKNDLLAFQSFINNVGFKGRGGTSHEDAFQYIENKIWKVNEERDKLSMVISLTDGESDIESVYTKFNWIKKTPLMFITPNNWTFNDSEYPNISTIKMK